MESQGQPNQNELIKQLKDFIKLLLKHMASFKVGDQTQNENLIKLGNLLEDANTTESLSVIRKDYRELIIKIDQQPSAARTKQKEGLFGSFFGKMSKDKKSSSELSLVDEKEEFIEELKSTVAAFAKGTLLMIEDNHPLTEALANLKMKKTDTFDSDSFEQIQKDLLTLFFSKSNEAFVVNREREELKNIISTLAHQIGTLSLSSNTFNEKISEYAIKIHETAELKEIIQIKEKILRETEQIQKENRLIKETMASTEIHLQGASRRIEELEAELLKTQIEMMKDPLTQVYNRRAFDEKIKDQLNRFKRYNESFALLIFDMDHFKKINDTYGHTAGDIVLKTVAALAKDSIRAVDFLGRFGGEEFVIILDKVEISEAFTISEKIRTNIGSHEFLYKKHNVGVSVSIGVAVCRKEDSAGSLLKRADDALYRAKNNGRNQTVKAD